MKKILFAMIAVCCVAFMSCTNKEQVKYAVGYDDQTLSISDGYDSEWTGFTNAVNAALQTITGKEVTDQYVISLVDSVVNQFNNKHFSADIYLSKNGANIKTWNIVKGESASILKQWSFNTAGTKYDVIDLSTENQAVFAESYDGTNFYKNGTYPCTISFSNTEKTAGTINYNMYGAKTIAFKNLTGTTVEIESQQLGSMPGMYDTYTASNYQLQER